MLIKRASKRSPNQATALQKYDFTYAYGTQTVQYSVWVTGGIDRIRTIIFLGTVQIGKLPIWIAEKCPPGTVVVQGAPHWLASADGSDIPAFMHRFTEEVFSSVLTAFTLENVHVIADSQAAPCVVGVLAQNKAYASKVQTVLLLQPLGFNAHIFAGSASDRIAIFKQRMRQNMRYQLPILPYDSRLRYNIRQLFRTVGYDSAKWKAQYGSGLTHNAAKDLARLYTTHIRVVIICGAMDMLFPPHEIKTMLHDSGLDIPLITVPGVPHSPLAAKQGMKLVQAAFNYLELS